MTIVIQNLKMTFGIFGKRVKLESRRLSLLAYKVEQIEKTLSAIFDDNRQRPDSEEIDKKLS